MNLLKTFRKKSKPVVGSLAEKKFIQIAIQMEPQHCTMLKDLMLRLGAYYVTKEKDKALGELCQFVAWAIDYSAEKRTNEATQK